METGILHGETKKVGTPQFGEKAEGRYNQV